ncbi:MAG: IS4 family transposase [Spirochaetales bacterium]|nr:IS4 family transposase [Spirochaetales bacterium]
MKDLPRNLFDSLVEEYGTDRHSKGFRSWDQLVAMMYGQLSGSRSLRELEVAFNSHPTCHYHLGTRQVKRSTLADANAKRDERLYARLSERLLARAHRKVRREVKAMLYLLDSTPISLKGRGYDDWAASQCTRRTQGLKVHMLYCPDQAAPVYSHITAPNVNDIEDAREMDLERGATYVFDKGYCDYNWWYKLEKAGAAFVTRFKSNAATRVVEAYAVPEKASATVLADERVVLSNRHPGGKRRNRYATALRRVTVAREGKTPLVLATNNFTRSAADIAALYKDRWQIELFFKWLKQNLKIKRFFGRSETAVRTQIYIALITYLLVWFYHARHRATSRLKDCVVMLGATLFQRPETEYSVWRRRQRERQAFLERQGALL